MFPDLHRHDDRPALRFGGVSVSYAQLRASAAQTAKALGDHERVAVWAAPSATTCTAVVAALLAGRTVIPINPRSGVRELEHVLGDSEPGLLLADDDVPLPDPLMALPRVAVRLDAPTGAVPAAGDEHDGEAAALIIYTSGTTGAPKGAVLPRRAITTNLDALAAAWDWTAADEVVHALPLFHVHGLVIGVLGPLRRGGTVHHLGAFEPGRVADALSGTGTMLLGVPTMYHRLAAAAESDPRVAEALAGARLLVSGSAALPAADHQRIERATGQQVVERYGMSETLMNASVRADGERRAGTVGRPVDGVEVRLVDDDGAVLETADDATIGEMEVRGPNLFLGYLNRADATAEAFRDGWFRTGDLATRAADGYLRIVGRRATDLIKSGGFKIGAGEIENALLEHPAVAEVAVTGAPDDDLGERVVAWVVLEHSRAAAADELVDHVATLLTPHKRPRTVHFLPELPRNELGKVQKRRLGA